MMAAIIAWDDPSPAMRERQGPVAQRWEGEGRCVLPLTRLAPGGTIHPFPHAAEGLSEDMR